MAVDYSELPGDLVTEILLRLPVKSIIRFNSVAKNWVASLISSLHFIWTLKLLKFYPHLEKGQNYWFYMTVDSLHVNGNGWILIEMV
ncbi:hypothetical protein COLO4_13494 [Corchorus olitorius]|uniref:F-box domain-containing protein n=1 Tax=Corchorus olitorius TaxID=93759 RepID=A0A1R3JWS1_9ROSI|nr:hypothetical protein COLO4_13494 [Corchorus olitorius]